MLTSLELRAFDRKNNKMYYITDLYFFEEEGIREVVDGVGKGSHAEYEISRCIGLRDKNGKKIYENDIVKFSKHHYEDCSQTKIESIDEPLIGNVYFAENLWFGLGFGDDTGSLFWPGTVGGEEFEVIGNLYENPELMEEAG